MSRSSRLGRTRRKKPRSRPSASPVRSRIDAAAGPGPGAEPLLSGNVYLLASVLLFVGLIGAMLVSLPDYGMSFDEVFRWQAGEAKLAYYQAWWQGVSVNELGADEPDLYPGLFDLSLALLERVSPFDLLVTGHLLSWGCGLLAIAGVWAIGWRLGGYRLAFWSALFLTFTPRFYGHAFFNPKDIPFAAMYVWSIYHLLRMAQALPQLTWWRLTAVGVSIGLTMAVRIGGMVLFGYVALILGASIAFHSLYRREQPLWPFAGRSLGGCLWIVTIAYLTLYPWWPYAHQNPLMVSGATLEEVTQFPWDGPVLFRGEYITASQLPWLYILVWLAITLPEFLLALLMVGSVFLIPSLKRMVEEGSYSKDAAAIGVLSLGALFPLGYVIARDATLYDGMRHLLFIVPPLTCLAACAFTQILDTRSIRQSWVTSWVIYGCVLGSILITGRQMYRLHPYTYVYFNRITGGLSGANGLFDTDYWGLSLREAVERTEASIPASLRGTPIRVAVGEPVSSAVFFMTERLEPVRDVAQAQLYLSTTRIEQHRRYPGRTILTVERDGVPLAVVKELSGTP